MRISVPALGCLLLFCLLTLGVPRPAPGQQASAQGGAAASGVNVYYTGQLYGYFRSPDLQSGRAEDGGQQSPEGTAIKTGCAAYENAAMSKAASQFESLWKPLRGRNQILVGTGDNFAPVLLAREFDSQKPPADQYRLKSNSYGRIGKDLFDWDPFDKVWVTTDTAGKGDHRLLARMLAEGLGTVPIDNAGCFLRREGYAAIVPGKYDFYFGPERLRELARFLASDKEDDGKGVTFQPVQMLAANLVIQTSWKSDHAPVGDKEDPPKFGLWSTAVAQASGTSEEAAVPALITPRDGGQVYPWFPGPELKLMDLSPNGEVLRKVRAGLKEGKSLADMLPDLQRGDLQGDPEVAGLTKIIESFPADQVFLCKSVGTAGEEDRAGYNPNPNEIPKPGSENCHDPLKKPELILKYRTVEYFYPLVTEETRGFETVEPGRNYGLCLAAGRAGAGHTISDKGSRHAGYYCSRFSVEVPFLQFPDRDQDPDCQGGVPACQYNDPQPYAFLPGDQPEQSVAIFGVVSPTLGKDVGLLNLGWRNVSRGNDGETPFKTETGAEDPAEALNEIVPYFELQHPHFAGIKILLAQMTPQEAQALASRVGGFDSVVSEASPQYSGTGETRSAEWRAGAGAGAGEHHAFLAIPEPYWDADHSPDERVDLGRLTITERTEAADPGQAPGTPRPSERKIVIRTLNTQHVREADNAEEKLIPVDAPAGFWSEADDYLKTRCGDSPGVKTAGTPGGAAPSAATAKPPDQALSDEEKATKFEKLAACAMQRATGADVTLMQKRDFYADWWAREGLHLTVQQFIERVIWKGDFLTLRYVPGSTLQTMMKESQGYDEDDASQVSLSDEAGRGLVAYGIRHDAVAGYLINEAPLDPTRLYAVATTDYIAAGDTGYPELNTSAAHPIVAVEDTDKRLREISGIVCQQVHGGSHPDQCMDAIDRDNYMDEIVMNPPDVRAGDTPSHQLWAWSWFDRGQTVPGSASKNASQAATGLEKAIEQRPLSSLRINPPNTTLFALSDSAISFSLTSHKFSQADVGAKYLGNTTPQLSAKASHSIAYDFRPQLSRSWQTWRLFLNTEESYNVQYTANANQARTISQKQNLFSADAGYARDFPNRILPHIEVVGTFHYETQMWHPSGTFLAPLPNQDKLAPNANLGRSHYFLPRLGVRYMDKTSWIEAGMEDGGQLDAVRLINPAPGGNVFGLERTNIRVSGAYWNWHLVVPLDAKLSWTEDEDGDIFFNEPGDAATDTRFRADTKTAVNFQVFPSLAFAPTYEIFLYANKVQEEWYWQNQVSIQMKLQFDFWNRRRIQDELKYKASSGGGGK